MDLSMLGTLFAPVITGILIGAALRGNECAKCAGKLFDGLALKFFLPFFVFEALNRGGLSWEMAGAVALGFVIPLFSLLLASIYLRFGQGGMTPRRPTEWRFLVSTFGGGNRGTAALYVGFGGVAHFNEILTWFALIDLGNFACLLMVFPVLLGRAYAGEGDSSRARKSLKIADNYALWMVGIVAALFLLSSFVPQSEVWLAESVAARKFIFSMLLFAAIALRFEQKALSGFHADLIATLSTRAVALLAVAVPVWLLFDQGRLAAVAAGILLLMPPSSVLPAMVAQTRARPEAVGYSSSFAAVANVLYLPILAMLALVAIGRTL
ncbi:MAG: hypothetical protein AB1918_02255 [Pseudomonadota bacterium]